jgi:hypothetical protein
MTHLRTRPLTALGLLMALVGAHCDDTTPVCVPDSTASCYCVTGGAGQKQCDTNGLDYGACSCLPDASVVEDKGATATASRLDP